MYQENFCSGIFKLLFFYIWEPWVCQLKTNEAPLYIMSPWSNGLMVTEVGFEFLDGSSNPIVCQITDDIYIVP